MTFFNLCATLPAVAERRRAPGQRKKILEELSRYTENELFYRRCYELRGDRAALARYAASFDLQDLRRRGLIVPGDQTLTRLREDDIYRLLRAPAGQNVLLFKHPRYTPGFEHCHDYFETFFVLTGQCVNTIGGQRLTHMAGSLCFIAPEVKHTFEVFDDSIIVNICLRRGAFDEIFFNLLTSDDILAGFFLGSIYQTHPVEYLVFDIGRDAGMLRPIFSLLAEQARPDAHSGRIMYYLVSLLFARLMRKYQRNPKICR